ncbi:hypothetical protein [Desulfovibrio falkowii]|uniref:hypothetical protein n=1 Tax=Desulfovibrio sp. WGS1351 TaxID=3366814 RepID=UPI00372D244B
MENSVWEVVLAIFASVGGAGAVIIALSKWLANLTAEKMLKKTEFEFSQKLEALKSSLEKRNYISKTRFDLEIEVYRQLSEAVVTMVTDNSALFPSGAVREPKDEAARNEFYRENYLRAIQSHNTANTAINRNTPFIPEALHKKFVDIADKSRVQLIMFGELKFHNPSEGDGSFYHECCERTNVINNELDNLMAELRSHIASLDVLDR